MAIISHLLSIASKSCGLSVPSVLPGQAWLVLDPSLMLIIDVVLCEDGHVQERSLLDQILKTIDAKDVWIDDRNFCTTGFLFGIARLRGVLRGASHGATLHWEFTGKKRACGRIDTGKVFQQTVRLSNPDTGEVLSRAASQWCSTSPLVMVTARSTFSRIFPPKMPMRKIAELYRGRWTIEMSHPDYLSSGNLYRGSRAA